MFINRYEIGLADFGATVADEWSYTLNAKSLDAYFYATEDPKDVLRGYTEISGHADMPKPWMQGVQICRYAPDFANFEKDLCCDSIKDYPDWETLFISDGDGYRSIKEVSEEACLAAVRFYNRKEDGTYALAYVKDDEGKWFKTRGRLNPLGSSVKTIMTKYIEADLKPDAANMEGSNWPTAFLANGEEKMAEHILSSLTEVKRTAVTVSRVEKIPEGELFRTETVTVQVQSERLDAIIAKVFSLSREDAQGYFAKSLVFVNGAAVENTSYAPKPLDKISVRTKGRFIYGGPTSLSKKGKLNVKIEKYI